MVETTSKPKNNVGNEGATESGMVKYDPLPLPTLEQALAVIAKAGLTTRKQGAVKTAVEQVVEMEGTIQELSVLVAKAKADGLVDLATATEVRKLARKLAYHGKLAVKRLGA